MEGEDARVEKMSLTRNESEKGIERRLRWNSEAEAHQMGQKEEGRVRSKDLQEGFQVMVG